MKVFYSRVSSTDGSQNPERQLQNLEGLIMYSLTNVVEPFLFMKDPRVPKSRN